MRLWRGPFGIAFRHVLRAGAAIGGGAVLVGIVMHPLTDAEGLAEDVPAAASAWLTLALGAVALTCCVVPIVLWPTFARERPGADAVRRLVRGRTGGRAGAGLGALLAQLLLAVPMALALAWWFDAPSTVRRHFAPAAPTTPVLDRADARLTFAAPPGAAIEQVWLRPRAALPTGPDPTLVRVDDASGPLNGVPASFVQSNQLVRMPIDRSPTDAVTLTHVGGDVPLYFPTGSVVLVGPADLPGWANAALLALLGAAVSAATLLVAALLGVSSRRPTLLAAVASAWFVVYVGGVGPIDDAVLAVLRGRWIGP